MNDLTIPTGEEIPQLTIRDKVKKRMADILETTDVSPEGAILQGVALVYEELRYTIGALGEKEMEVFVDNLEKDIEDFHKKFKITYDGPPRNLPGSLNTKYPAGDTLDFRMKLLKEEMQELHDAAQEGDLVKQLDALVDIVYVCIGWCYLAGFPFLRAWEVVHASNMTKMIAAPGKGKYGSTIAKGPDYIAPNLKPLIEKKNEA